MTASDAEGMVEGGRGERSTGGRQEAGGDERERGGRGREERKGEDACK